MRNHDERGHTKTRKYTFIWFRNAKNKHWTSIFKQSFGSFLDLLRRPIASGARKFKLKAHYSNYSMIPFDPRRWIWIINRFIRGASGFRAISFRENFSSVLRDFLQNNVSQSSRIVGLFKFCWYLYYDEIEICRIFFSYSEFLWFL